MIKMVALDLDGTLLTSDKNISKVNENVLKQIHHDGIKVVLCTGRPINAIWPYIEQLGLTGEDDYTITFNGALVVHNNDKQELFKQGMTKASFEPLFEYANQANGPLDILDFDRVYSIADLKNSMYQQQFKGNIEFVSRSFSDLGEDDLYSKGIVCDKPEVLDEFRIDMPVRVGQQYHIVRSQPQIMEFLAPKMDKTVGLKALLKHFGWNFNQLMAFGDSDNDLGMITHAEIGVAMKNGKEEIKAVSSVVTTDNDSDGVGQYLKSYFSIR